MSEATISPAFMARSNDPGTSKDAAQRVDEFRRAHHAQILNVLQLHPDGLTVYEIASMCSIDAHAVGKRMKELETAGDCEVVADLTGEVKRQTPSGRAARVWRRVVVQIGGAQ